MRYMKSVILVIALGATLSKSATAQRQVRFDRWAVPALAPLSRRSLGVSLPDSVRQKVGYQHWKGAAIGAGVGALLASVLVFGVAGECDDCTENRWARGEAALLITGASGAFGFLVGLATPRYAWKPSHEASPGE
jgi:hypothetical protein